MSEKPASDQADLATGVPTASCRVRRGVPGLAPGRVARLASPEPLQAPDGRALSVGPRRFGGQQNRLRIEPGQLARGVRGDRFRQGSILGDLAGIDLELLDPG
jgi:hypothetical protein